MQEYDFKKIEEKWAKYWVEKKSYKAEDFSEKPKFYVLSEFFGPNGKGIHLGHVKCFTPTDIIARYMRFKGYSITEDELNAALSITERTDIDISDWLAEVRAEETPQLSPNLTEEEIQFIESIIKPSYEPVVLSIYDKGGALLSEEYMR